MGHVRSIHPEILVIRGTWVSGINKGRKRERSPKETGKVQNKCEQQAQNHTRGHRKIEVAVFSTRCDVAR